MKTEDWLLEQLEADPVPLADIRQALAEADAEGQGPQADAWAQLAQETLAAKGQTGEAVEILAARAAAWADTPETRDAARRQAADIAAGDRALRKLMEESGFGPDLPAPEAVRRLRVLQSLAPGTVCYDATWGVGEVRKVDLFYKKLTIDFESKRNHSMAFSYAAESLRILSNDHLFARWKHAPGEMEALVRDHPGQVVREIIRWFGPQPVAQVQELLIPRLLRDDQWKDFWDAARRELKKDLLFEIPSKRSEPLRILTEEENFGSSWFASLSGERDMKAVLNLVESLAGQSDLASLPDERRAVAADRLAFVVTGAARRPDLRARAALAREALGLAADPPDEAHPTAFFDETLFLRTATHLPARHVGPFLQLLRAQDEERALSLFAACLPRAGGTALNELIQALVSAGREDLCREIVQGVFARKEPHIELLSWLHRNPESMRRWVRAEPFDTANLTLDALESEAAGDLLKARNLMRDRCARDEWLREFLGAMTADQRREWVARLKQTRAWSSLDRQSIIGRAIKMYPDCQAVMSREAEAAPAESRTRATSQRSYILRQRAYRKLIETDIPANSRDIAEARAHGDLRENAEFKAAKEMQGILLQRRAEAERDLKLVQPTAFKQAFTGRIGPGTGVTLAYPDGRSESYWILGEWDSDDGLRIIPSSARLAQVLEGKREGDEVLVPGIDGDAACAVRSVRELTQEIRAWIESDPEPTDEGEIA
jgi:transcription elongation GreA/GreB family factor